MSTPAAQPQAAASEQALLGALAVVLLSGLPAPVVIAHALPLLAQLGVPPLEATGALSLVLPHLEAPGTAQQFASVERPGPAQAYNSAIAVTRQVEYLVAAGRRLRGDGTARRERSHLAAHLRAQAARQQAALRVDEAAREHGPMLGWYAIRDRRTTPECRAAHGANFSALAPPRIGWPGTLHGGTCRCLPGPAHASELTVDEATAALEQNAVIPFVASFSRAPSGRRLRLWK